MEYISGEQEQLRDMPHPGFKHSPETRARLSAAHVGKRHSPETRQKISAANIGKHSDKKISPEHRAAVSAANRGKEFSLTHRERISATLIAYYERVSPPSSPAERHRRERWREYKRALLERRRANRVQKEKT